MNFKQRLRVLVQQFAYTPRLGSTQVLRHYPSCREGDRVFPVRHFTRIAIRSRVKMRLAVRGLKLPVLPKPRCSGMVKFRTWPENAHVLFDLFVSDAIIISGATLRCHTQFVEYSLAVFKCEFVTNAKPLGKIDNDITIATRISRGCNCSVNLNNPSFRCGHGSLLFLV